MNKIYKVLHYKNLIINILKDNSSFIFENLLRDLLRLLDVHNLNCMDLLIDEFKSKVYVLWM